MLGRTREEILREGRLGLIDCNDPRLEPFITGRERSGIAHGEPTARRKDGTLFPVEFSSVMFLDHDGNPRTCLLMRDISERKASEPEREGFFREICNALARVKSLSGLLPICASCRKIRNSQRHWHNLELYIRKHTEADFTYGICPDCRQTLYRE